MARQKSEERIVPQGARKGAPTREDEQPGGGKAVPVNQQAQQLCLPFATAANPEVIAPGPRDRADRDRSRPARRVGPKAKVKAQTAEPATIEGVVGLLEEAFDQVARNQGAPGPDRQTIAQVRRHWGELRARLADDLLQGSYQPGLIRRAYIPKVGGQRGLGIPNVVDRVVQEAVRRALEPLYEPTFHASSHGFRPGRSCHTALTEAVEHLKAGYEVMVDLDLEKFFDRVNHQRLMARLAQRVGDRRLLILIGRMLKAKVVMPEGVIVGVEEGVPQGGPLSPLLSNVVLDELDRELVRRGLRFVRYADDVSIFVRSARAGQRVLASIGRFIERRLRLKLNAAKSAVARPEERPPGLLPAA
jgi:group II intron reverse transcriptase/maturase